VRLRTRLVLFIAAATLGPLALLGVGATQVATRQVLERSSEVQARTAEGLALYADTWLSLQIAALKQQAAAFPVAKLDDSDRLQFLRLVYRQSPHAQIVTLTDLSGADLAPGVFQDTGFDLVDPPRDLIDADRYRDFRKALPLRALAQERPGSHALGQLNPISDRGAPVLPVALRLEGREVVLGVELGLDPLAQRFGDARRGEAELALLDASGRILLGGEGLVDPAAFRSLRSGDIAASEVRYANQSGTEVLASSAAVPAASWTVVVAEPLAVSQLAATEIRDRTAYIAAVSAVLALLVGVLFSRQLSDPVVVLKDAAMRVARGQYGHEVEPQGADEQVGLAHAFNYMSKQLARDQREIGRQRKEIEAFNLELQARVDERTRELREAQEQLVASAGLAAVGELGAGLAHELNNPLAGILGLTQVLRAKAGGGGGMLASIESEARRCTEIVAQLLRISEGGRSSVAAAGEPVDRGHWDVVDLRQLLSDVLTLVGGPFRQRGVALVHEEGTALQVRADPAELGRALTQLLTTVRGAAAGGSTLRVHGVRTEDEIRLVLELSEVAESGRSDDWMAAGFGFWAARRSVEDHGGHLVVPAELTQGEGASWTLVLPEA